MQIQIEGSSDPNSAIIAQIAGAGGPYMQMYLSGKNEVQGFLQTPFGQTKKDVEYTRYTFPMNK